MGAPFIVINAPNGARRQKTDHPALPITPEEIGSCAESVLREGASIVHIHVRDDAGKHSLDVNRYRSAIDAIRDRVGSELIIQVTTEACGIFTPEQQIDMVRELKPEAVSLALRELCADAAAEAAAADFFAWLNAENVMAQHILYAPKDVVRFEDLRRRGVIVDEAPFALFVLGRYTDNLTGDVNDLEAFVREASEDTTWAVCCFGATEQEAVNRAADLGGHARVGFENNLLLENGAVARDNALLVRNAAEAGRARNRQPANADDVRSLFGQG
jgi:uncharacterized protein (DUF849 family)